MFDCIMTSVGLTIQGPNCGSRSRLVAWHSFAALLATTALGVTSAHAIDGTWTGVTGEWVDGTNWSSNPDVPDGTATFTDTGTVTVTNNAGIIIIGTIQFTSAPNAQAYAFTLNNPAIINASGIINDSTIRRPSKLHPGIRWSSKMAAPRAAAPAPSPSPTMAADSSAFRTPALPAAPTRRSSIPAFCSSATPARQAAPTSPTMGKWIFLETLLRDPRRQAAPSSPIREP